MPGGPGRGRSGEGAAAQQPHHLDAGERRLAALVVSSGSERSSAWSSVSVVSTPKTTGTPGRQLHLLDPRRALPGHEVVVAGLARGSPRRGTPPRRPCRRRRRPGRPAAARRRPGTQATVTSRRSCPTLGQRVEARRRAAAVVMPPLNSAQATPTRSPRAVVLAAQSSADARPTSSSAPSGERPGRSRPSSGRGRSAPTDVVEAVRAGGPSARAWSAGRRCSRGWATARSGTRSVMSRPKPSRPPYLTGLFVMRRMVVTPRSTSIWAPMPYSRLSTGRPSSQVGVDGVVALLLELVGADLVAEADAAALVAAQVDEDARALLLDQVERGLQLGPAVAAQRAEDVAGQALGVHPDEHVLARRPRRPCTSARCCSPSSTDS